MKMKKNLGEYSELDIKEVVKKNDIKKMKFKEEDKSEALKPPLLVASLLNENGKFPLSLSAVLFLMFLASIPELIMETIARGIYHIWTVLKAIVKRGTVLDN